MSDDTIITGPGGRVLTPAPSLGQKLMFSLPAIIIALILAIGISYAILASVNSETLKRLAEVETHMNDKTGKLTKDLETSETARKTLEKDLKTVTDRATKLEEEKSAIDKRLTSVNESFDKFVTDITKFEKDQTAMDSEHTSKLISHETNINALETRVKYIDDKLKKLDDIAIDVASLKVQGGSLQKEYEVLKGDLTTVRSKTDVTEKDLADLSERARLFQLRVLAARAREAAEAARKTDLKGLLSRLDDVEDK